MNLYLMRHGLAVERGTPGQDSDRERPLTPKGERKVRRIAESLVKMEISFDAIFSSPLVRARQTAEVLRDEMNSEPEVQLTEHLAPGGKPSKIVNLLQHLPDSPQAILLVGHEPDLGELAASLLTGGAGVTLIFKKGGVAKLTVDSVRAGRCATLEWLMAPRHLELMA